MSDFTGMIVSRIRYMAWCTDCSIRRLKRRVKNLVSYGGQYTCNSMSGFLTTSQPCAMTAYSDVGNLFSGLLCYVENEISGSSNFAHPWYLGTCCSYSGYKRIIGWSTMNVNSDGCHKFLRFGVLHPSKPSSYGNQFVDIEGSTAVLLWSQDSFGVFWIFASYLKFMSSTKSSQYSDIQFILTDLCSSDRIILRHSTFSTKQGSKKE